MDGKIPRYKRELLNQLINFFWTVLSFAPVVWFWVIAGVNSNFYIFLIVSFAIGILPENFLDRLLLSSRRDFYENFGVKFIRKFVQNGDTVSALAYKERHFIIKDVSQAKRYLRTISMYERYHWACFSFFLLTTILSFIGGHLILGLLMIIFNMFYNVSAILLQQYNKVRIRKLIG